MPGRDSWHALVGMSVGDAMLKYTSVVGEVDPDWETDTLNSTAKQVSQIIARHIDPEGPQLSAQMCLCISL